MKLKINLKSRWAWIVVGAVALAVFMSFRACSYERKIAAKDKQITALEKKEVRAYEKIASIESRVSLWREKSLEQDRKIYVLGRERDREREAKDAAMKKIRDMAPGQVVFETAAYLGGDYLKERLDGILFSFEGARVNLGHLANEDYLMREVNNMGEQIDVFRGQVTSLNFVIVGKEEIITEKDKVIFLRGQMLREADAKFILSENKRRAAFKKGLFIGVPVGAGATYALFRWVLPLIKK